MNRFILLCSIIGVCLAKDGEEEPGFQGPSFEFTCPEPNGRFRDEEQCDLYYSCVDGVAKAELCEDGYFFNDALRNHESCQLGLKDCGDRIYVQEPDPERDPRCGRANGFFEHEDPNVCDKFYLCSKGVAHEMPCNPGLVFDIASSTCVFPDGVSIDARVCAKDTRTFEEGGEFQCPKEEQFLQGVRSAHPVYAHPSDCRFFFSCFDGKTPQKFGCSESQAFDDNTKTCKGVDEVPECACWYGCKEDSQCPDSCNADCSCPTA
ncbi:protein obstructor-E-like [Tigriopus californicus]|nr:protein obstructor-E-like [Tigriopus californicus]